MCRDSRFPYNFLAFYPISVISSAYQKAGRALHFKWKFIFRKWKRKGKKEDEHFQLLYYLRYIDKCDTDGFLNHRKLQICKRFPTKLFRFAEPTSFVDLIDLQNRLKTRFFFHVNQVQKSCYFFKTNYRGGESFADL